LPELPEVETICRGLNQLTLEQSIEGGEVLLTRTLAYPQSVSDFWQGVKGTKIGSWQRRGKYILAELIKPSFESAAIGLRPRSAIEKSSSKIKKDSSLTPSFKAGWLGVHLRMTGQLLWVDRHLPLQKHTRIRLFLDSDKELRFVDTRTFGKFWFVPPQRSPQEIITGLQLLGPEPFSSDFSLSYFANKIGKSQRNIKTLLLDQSIVAGIGNIYADEALFKSGIRPDAIANHLDRKQIERLHLAIIEILQTAIDKGGTTFSDFLSVTGVNGNYGGVAWVYGRKDEPCRICGTSIERIKLGGRSSHFCPQCQLPAIEKIGNRK
jgi:formamidopyrimidine-DNA glycosylase